jgi:hypothetical protein
LSDYQYFEFQTVDRALGEREMRELRELSRRARITPTRFMNTYDWSDFRGDPVELMDKYFDSFVHVANWGKRQFILRLPRKLVDPDSLKPYCAGTSLWMKLRREHVLLGFSWEGAEGGWEGEGEGWISALLPMRSDILNGDRRALYLGWLVALQAGQVADDESEPPPPPGLGQLPLALQGLVDFLAIKPQLIAAAASAEAAVADSSPGLEDWVAALPVERKTELLSRAARGEAPYLQAELLREFEDSRTRQPARATRGAKTPRKAGRSEDGLRSVSELVHLAEELASGARARTPRRESRPAGRGDRVTSAAWFRPTPPPPRPPSSRWDEIESIVQSRRASAYEKAVKALSEVRADAETEGSLVGFQERLREFRKTHAKKTGLTRLLQKAKLE